MGALIGKAMAGFAFLLTILALALFIPAGSLNFWQGWVYLAVFGGCTLLITAYLAKYDPELLASRTQAGPVAETEKSQKLIQSFASLFFISLFIVTGLDYRFHWSAVPPLVSLIADGLVAFGFFLVFLVFRENSYTSAVIEVAKEQQVITTGPYSVVRHPMYSGALLMLIFSTLALGSWMALPLVIPLAIVIGVRAVEEEKFLTANLKGYREYTQKVRYRLIPFIW